MANVFTKIINYQKKGLDRSWKSWQRKLLNILGALTNILEMAEDSHETGSLSDPTILSDWAQQDLSEKLFHQQLLKKRQGGLEEQKDQLVKESRQLLTLLKGLEKTVVEEQSKFMKEVSDFNNAYALTNNRELLVKKQVKTEICSLELEACDLRDEMERMEQENVHLNALHLQKNSLKEELGELKRKLKGLFHVYK
ncbi:hypothetical protein NDU88_006596 [Pleurodeles waltl]|uniref:Coiled-coil domain-containing protein 172 n=1 Tax=Pleurodeles waltl TaxID=8319 RepID=A0AAV7QME5_PLEWA|nr:hypothetical protein NDU88_006596 [Pleurodeles waltl]